MTKRFEKAYAAPAGGAVRRRSGGGPAAGKKRRVIIDAGASRRGGGPGDRRRGRGRGRGRDREEQQTAPVVPTGLVKVPSGSTVKDISQLLGITTPDIIKALMGYGEMVTITRETLSDEAIEVLATDFGREIEITHAADEEAELEKEAVDDPGDPGPELVITVMGHVDHGKTSLLDAIRDTAVAAGEAGGITQHIGAYQVKHNGRATIIDTPGHAAFTAMRARGAKVTDIAAIVVAADDGVMPQSVEAIDHAKAAQVPVVIVINKIDKPDANIERIGKVRRARHRARGVGRRQHLRRGQRKAAHRARQLPRHTLLLVAEVSDLKANGDAPASGFIIESKVDPGRGVVATMLVSRGTIHVGDAIVAGEASGKVRAMRDFRGEPLKAGGPSTRVEIIGFDELPVAGEFCRVVKDKRAARTLGQKRSNRIGPKRSPSSTHSRSTTSSRASPRARSSTSTSWSRPTSRAASRHSATRCSSTEHPEVKVRIIHSGVGGVNESDVMLAAASTAIIIGFNVRPSPQATTLAESEGVDIRTYRVIYKVTEDITAALVGMLKPTIEEVVLGQAEVRTTFKAAPSSARSPGCMVTHGKIVRDAGVRVLRNDVVVHDGKMGSPQALRRRRARSWKASMRHPARRLQRPQRRGRAGGVRDQRSRP